MRRAKLNRHAKIVATLGPASSEPGMISDLILNGMNVCRVNMSHGTHAEHARLIADIRRASRSLGLEVAVLMDLQGPKIRVDRLRENLELGQDETWVVGQTKLREEYPEYEKRFIPTVYEQLVQDLADGVRILFDDGLIVAETIARDRDVYKIKVSVGGTLKSHKGINLPDSKVSAPSLTDKDREDVLFGLEHDIDYIALSFVRRREDILELKNYLERHGANVPIVSKMENPEAIENMEEILDESDVVMVARGDLGVELGNHLVPSAQKEIISLCNRRGIPVITATQMLESMIDNPSPTRAEASDVANAIWDGSDAVMLSAETAVGRYPLEAVKMMGLLITEAERTPKERASLKLLDLSAIDDATMIGASLIAEKIGAKRILSVTQSGSSCLKMSRFRSETSVLGVSNSLAVVRKLCLYWGVSPFYLENYDEDDRELERHVIDQVRVGCELEAGDRIVITRGSGKFFAHGSSNSIKVVVVE